jgi:uncharacterized protein YbbK (DUF523 family)
MVNCRYDSSRRCFHNLCCSIFDAASGSVSVCPFFRGGDFHTPHRAGLQLHSISNKHLRRYRGDRFG